MSYHYLYIGVYCPLFMVKYTRRHYEDMAKWMNENVISDEGFSDLQCESMINTLCEWYIRDNDRFDRSRFETACGYPRNN